MRLRYLILLSISGTVIALDQFTKHLIMQKLAYAEAMPVISGFFNITHVRNPGAAFGFLARLDSSIRVPFFIIVPITALGVIAYIFKKLEDHAHLVATALSLVIGGAVGNLIDRLTYNFVVDFLDFHYSTWHFPSFNVADSAICVGVGLLIWDIIRKEIREKKNASHAA